MKMLRWIASMIFAVPALLLTIACVVSAIIAALALGIPAILLAGISDALDGGEENRLADVVADSIATVIGGKAA